MSRLFRIYFNALFGALGGLLGWMLFGEFVSRDWDWQGQALVGGGLIGAMIGYLVVSVDGILDRALVRFCRYAAYGVILGSLGGMVGFWIGDWVNYVLVGLFQSPAWRVPFSVIGRGLGWMVFGLAVGASGGIAARSMGKFWYGTVGGSLGGLIGGATFGCLMEVLQKDTSSYTHGQATGLVVLGACIGGLIALVEEVFKPASLKVMRGWQEGREYSLVKAASVIGRDERADILLLRDMKVEKHHAVVHRRGGRFLFVNNQSPAEQTLVNEEPVSQSVELHDGDRIQLGNVVLKFLMRAAMERKKKSQ